MLLCWEMAPAGLWLTLKKLAAPHELTNLKLEARSKEAEGMTKYVAFSPAEGA